MKITKEHYDHLRELVEPFDTEENRKLYLLNGFTTTRYQWDIMRACKGINFVCEILYKYLNDDHIQTALNKIIKPL